MLATHEAEEADAVDARAAAAEETHHGEDEAEDDQRDRKLIDDDDRLRPVVDEERPQRQRLAPHVQPDTACYQRPSANLHAPTHIGSLHDYELYIINQSLTIETDLYT